MMLSDHSVRDDLALYRARWGHYLGLAPDHIAVLLIERLDAELGEALARVQTLEEETYLDAEEGDLRAALRIVKDEARELRAMLRDLVAHLRPIQPEQRAPK